jgi:hypothetical protein
MKRLILMGVVTLAFAGCGAAPEETESATSEIRCERQDPRVFPRDSHPYGASYGEWSARQWRWLFSLPATGHPGFDETGADAGKGQSGPVWFLLSVFNATGSATRTITVPEGTALFFPIADNECSDVEAPPFYGADNAARRTCAQAFHYTGIAAELDGTALRGLEDHRVTSPPFSFTVPADNLLGVPAGTEVRSVSDGYFVMLKPLARGWHDLHFTGTIVEFGATINLTYRIRVVPRHR